MYTICRLTPLALQFKEARYKIELFIKILTTGLPLLIVCYFTIVSSRTNLLFSRHPETIATEKGERVEIGKVAQP